MHRLRKQKLSKLHQHSLPSHPTHTHNIEEAARMNLIQISHADYLQKDQQPSIDETMIVNLPTDDHPAPQKNNNSCPHEVSKDGRDQIINQFKRLTEDLERIGRDRRFMHSDRSYRFGDRFLNITMRNPLAVSSYVVSGGRKAPLARNSTHPPISQYVIRQQRNLHKFRRSESKQEAHNTYEKSYRQTQLRYYSHNADTSDKKVRFSFKDSAEKNNLT